MKRSLRSRRTSRASAGVSGERGELALRFAAGEGSGDPPARMRLQLLPETPSSGDGYFLLEEAIRALPPSRCCVSSARLTCKRSKMNAVAETGSS